MYLGSEEFEDPSLYRSVVGALQYITITRPDLSFAVCKVSQFMHRPLVSHWKAVKRVLRYLQGTKHYGLIFNQCSDYRLYGFTDSDWAADLEDRKSVSGFCVFLGTNLISWYCRKQTTISRSSTEVEFRSLASYEVELEWIQNLLMEMKIKLDTSPTIFYDNMSTCMLAANPILYNKTKHFQLDIQCVRDKINSKLLQIVHIPGTEQIANILTKPLSSTFDKFRNKLRMVQRPLLSLKGV
ncbi:secreted RxLR effector protein 161-like [Arachis hypogaea]|uniref:secreted RxLR effector protein 161-like n=1 Tax=Arachis hypogaea TaxID=3818 RepID=UPI003B21F9B9